MYLGDDIQIFDNGTDIAAVRDSILNTSYTQNQAPSNFQPCGGYFNHTNGEEMYHPSIIQIKAKLHLTNLRPYLKSDLISTGYQSHKGFLCPRRSLCVEQDNPYSGTVSFDNIFQSLELVFVIMSSNTFSDLMYDLTDSDFLVAALCKYPKRQ